jgi:hypothetical protein
VTILIRRTSTFPEFRKHGNEIFLGRTDGWLIANAIIVVSMDDGK